MMSAMKSGMTTSSIHTMMSTMMIMLLFINLIGVFTHVVVFVPVQAQVMPAEEEMLALCEQVNGIFNLGSNACCPKSRCNGCGGSNCELLAIGAPIDWACCSSRYGATGQGFYYDRCCRNNDPDHSAPCRMCPYNYTEPIGYLNAQARCDRSNGTLMIDRNTPEELMYCYDIDACDTRFATDTCGQAPRGCCTTDFDTMYKDVFCNATQMRPCFLPPRMVPILQITPKATPAPLPTPLPTPIPTPSPTPITITPTTTVPGNRPPPHIDRILPATVYMMENTTVRIQGRNLHLAPENDGLDEGEVLYVWLNERMMQVLSYSSEEIVITTPAGITDVGYKSIHIAICNGATTTTSLFPPTITGTDSWSSSSSSSSSSSPKSLATQDVSSDTLQQLLATSNNLIELLPSTLCPRIIQVSCPVQCPRRSWLWYSGNCTSSYPLGTGGVDCHRCPAHAECPQGRVWPHTDYWNENENDRNVIECSPPLRGERCQGGPDAPCGRGYEGIACSQCQQNYFSTGGVLCKSCQDEEVLPTMVLVVSIAFYLTLGCAVIFFSNNKFDKFILLVNSLQQLAGIYVAVIALLPEDARVPQRFLQILLLDYGFVRVGCDIGRLTYPQRYLASLLALFVMFVWMMLCAVIYQCRRSSSSSSSTSGAGADDQGGDSSKVIKVNVKGTRDSTTGTSSSSLRSILFQSKMPRLLRVVISTFHISYLHLAIKSATIINCIEVNGKMLLRSELSTECFVGTHMATYIIALILMVVLLLAVPSYFLYHLHRASPIEKKTDRFKHKWGFLISFVKPQYFWFQCLTYVVSISIALISNLFASQLLVVVWVGFLVFLSHLAMVLRLLPKRTAKSNIFEITKGCVRVIFVVVLTLFDQRYVSFLAMCGLIGATGVWYIVGGSRSQLSLLKKQDSLRLTMFPKVARRDIEYDDYDIDDDDFDAAMERLQSVLAANIATASSSSSSSSTGSGSGGDVEMRKSRSLYQRRSEQSNDDREISVSHISGGDGPSRLVSRIGSPSASGNIPHTHV